MENNKIVYAGFFTRLLATLVDIVVVSFVVNIIENVVTLHAFFILMIWWLYVSVMLIRWHTTIGGKLFGIEVLKSDDLKPLNFKWASVRFFVSIAPFSLYLYVRGMQHIMDIPPTPTMTQLPQLIFMLLPMIMFFTKKKQMIHDFIVHSVVIDVNKQMNTEKVKQNKSVHMGQKILRVVGTLAFLAMFGYLLVYVSVFYMLGKSSQKSYDASFSTQYKTDDYNNSKIIFYNKELEKYSEKFMNANGMYEIFEADVKRDLALNCIQASLKEHNVSDWIEEGSHFRKNARNLYAQSEDQIIRAKKNANYMGKHFYDYDLNEVNDIVDQIANVWEINKNKETCEKLLSVDKMYDNMFIYKYIDNREWALSRYATEWVNASYVGTLNKTYYSNQKDKTQEWLNMLYKRYPSYKEHQKQQEVEAKIYVEKIRKEEKKTKKVKLKKRNDDLMESAQKSGDLGTVKMLRVKQIIGDKATIPHMGYREKTGILKITIHGANCTDFVFPPKIQCKSY